jgi:hypothetical protein
MRNTGARARRCPPVSFLHDVGICELPDEIPDDATLKSRIKSGDPEAQYIQAVLHYKGSNASLDWDLAQSLMRKSAEQGYPRAQYSFAHFAQNAVGMPADSFTAQNYYYQASLSGIPSATNSLVALQTNTIFRERYGTKRHTRSPFEYERPKRQPDVTFGSPLYIKKSTGQYSPHKLPRRLQKTNPLGL